MPWIEFHRMWFQLRVRVLLGVMIQSTLGKMIQWSLLRETGPLKPFRKAIALSVVACDTPRQDRVCPSVRLLAEQLAGAETGMAARKPTGGTATPGAFSFCWSQLKKKNSLS